VTALDVIEKEKLQENADAVGQQGTPTPAPEAPGPGSPSMLNPMD